jgi:predicted HTH domain antitoxin
MGIQLKITDSVAEALRLPPGERQQRLATELALSLYSQGILSFGKARELAGLSKRDFGLLLGQRQIPRHYDSDDLQDDISYARGE